MRKDEVVTMREVENIGMADQDLTLIFPFIGARKVTIEAAYVVSHFDDNGSSKASTIVFETDRGTYVLDFDKVKMYPVFKHGEYIFEDICVVTSELMLNMENDYYYTESSDIDLINFDENGLYFFDATIDEVL